MTTSDGHLELGPGNEFDAIRGLIGRWGNVARGIGDDAAVLEIPRGDQLVVSVDSFVAGRHFEPDWLRVEDIGYRATAAALSDLAAMAAWPIGVLFAINLPDAWRDHLARIADGVADAARHSQTRIVGGNISAAAELSITTTVVGHAFRPLTRSGAGADDILYVTGELGGPAAAIRAWRAGHDPDPVARERFACPRPRLVEARWLASRGATSCIDISDGVVADVGHIAAASRVHIELQLDRLPVIAGVDVAGATGGEEYELLITSPTTIDADEFKARFGIPLTQVGRVVEGAPGVTTLDHGSVVAAPAGHDHFSR